MILSKYNLFTNQRHYQRLFQLQKPLSNHVKAKQFPNTFNLPCLPVPELNHTIEKYLKTSEPFLNRSELNNTKKLLQEFISDHGIGRNLQKLLVEKAKKHENWLEDWWLDTAYLEYRDPVVVYSSPGLVFPFEDFQNESQRLNYASNLILAALNYQTAINNDQIPLEKIGKDHLDMNQYKKIFGTCRLPGKLKDSLKFHPGANHIIVVRNNNFFKLEVVGENNEFPSLNQLVSSLEVILEESNEFGPPVGVLSTQNRDDWYESYEELKKDPLNRISIDQIEKSLFLVALDNPMPEFHDNWRSMASKQCIHGGGSRGNSANRWFDKTLQFIIGEDGTVGLTYEHSPSEGQPIAVMTDYLIDYIKKNISQGLPDVKVDPYPKKLEFNVSEMVQRYVQKANVDIDKLAENLEMASFQFNSFGKEFVKSQKLSPDSFIQMAIQYAFYRLHKVPGAHYESASTRKYIHGRTETIRSCSTESVAFAKAMLDKEQSLAQKVNALKTAIASHKQYAMDAVNGFGVDRHLLGLKLIAKENGYELPAIFKDPAFTRSSHMRLSTSQVATKCDGFMCYGPLTIDGYGCCYNPRIHDINFGVSAFVEHPDTSAVDFRESLKQSLHDMHDILAKSQKSKL